MQRRTFNRIIGLGAIAIPAVATHDILDLPSVVKPKIPLGLCNHSLRSMRLTARQLLDFAIQEELDSLMLNTFQPFSQLDNKYLQELLKDAKSNHITIYTGVGSISKTSTQYSDKYESPENLLREGIRVASALESPIVGVRIGNINDRYQDGGIEPHIEAVIKVMKSVRTQASDAGVKFAFENHVGDLRSKELLMLINETGDDICGALYDPGNAIWAMEDPMKALDVLGSKIIATSVRDVTIWQTHEGAVFQWVAIGEGMLDFPLFTKKIAERCPGVPIHVETISNVEHQLPFLKTDFWTGFPNLNASEIIDFLKMVRQDQPMGIQKPPASMNQKAFDIALQKKELSKSFGYLRKECHVGLK